MKLLQNIYFFATFEKKKKKFQLEINSVYHFNDEMTMFV